MCLASRIFLFSSSFSFSFQERKRQTPLRPRRSTDSISSVRDWTSRIVSRHRIGSVGSQPSLPLAFRSAVVSIIPHFDGESICCLHYTHTLHYTIPYSFLSIYLNPKIYRLGYSSVFTWRLAVFDELREGFFDIPNEKKEKADIKI